MKNNETEYSIMDILLEPNFSWYFNRDRNKQTSSVKNIIKGKKQKTNINDTFDKELRDKKLREKKTRRKMDARKRLIKNQKRKKLNKGIK